MRGAGARLQHTGVETAVLRRRGVRAGAVVGPGDRVADVDRDRGGSELEIGDRLTGIARDPRQGTGSPIVERFAASPRVASLLIVDLRLVASLRPVGELQLAGVRWLGAVMRCRRVRPLGAPMRDSRVRPSSPRGSHLLAVGDLVAVGDRMSGSCRLTGRSVHAGRLVALRLELRRRCGHARADADVERPRLALRRGLRVSRRRRGDIPRQRQSDCGHRCHGGGGRAPNGHPAAQDP